MKSMYMLKKIKGSLIEIVSKISSYVGFVVKILQFKIICDGYALDGKILILEKSCVACH